MNYKVISVLIVGLIIGAIFIAAGQTMKKSSDRIEKSATVENSVKNDKPDNTNKSQATINSDDEFNGEKIVKSDAEWKRVLTKEQFYVLREKRTERPYTGEYADNHEDGDYYCAACHLKLFSSKTK